MICWLLNLDLLKCKRIYFCIIYAITDYIPKQISQCFNYCIFIAKLNQVLHIFWHVFILKTRFFSHLFFFYLFKGKRLDVFHTHSFNIPPSSHLSLLSLSYFCFNFSNKCFQFTLESQANPLLNEALSKYDVERPVFHRSININQISRHQLHS